eukprot:5929356-Pyramimonas_sp.AAC.1
MQLGLRVIRIVAIVREVMSSFISDGHFVGYPGRIIRAARGSTDNVHFRRRRDDYALDCRIRTAVQGSDGRPHRRLGPYIDADTELQDKDAGPFRTACGKFVIL